MGREGARPRQGACSGSITVPWGQGWAEGHRAAKASDAPQSGWTSRSDCRQPHQEAVSSTGMEAVLGSRGHQVERRLRWSRAGQGQRLDWAKSKVQGGTVCGGYPNTTSMSPKVCEEQGRGLCVPEGR